MCMSGAILFVVGWLVGGGSGGGGGIKKQTIEEYM